MKKISKLILNILIFVLSIAFVNAGLVIEPNSININKTYGEDYFVDLKLRNTEAFSFYNIIFENNQYISITKIDELKSGENISVKAKINSNDNTNVNIDLIGFYNGSVGNSNLVYDYDVNKDVLAMCNPNTPLAKYELIKGDTLKINNLDSSDLLLYQNENLIATIVQGSSYLIQDLDIGSNYIYRLEYKGHTSGFPFGHCYVNVKMLSATDLIHRKKYDGHLNLNLVTYFEKTNVSCTFTETSYVTEFFNTQEGFFMIKNEGNKIAKDITISANDWFTFIPNIFDLDIGQNKLVTYKIKPKIINTSETNKTYDIDVKINGNFDELIQNFSVFVKYAEVNDEYTGSYESLIEFITRFCNENPTICNTEERIIYRDINDSENYFNVTLGEQQLRQLFNTWLEEIERSKTVDTYFKEQFDLFNIKMNTTNVNSVNAVERVNSVNDKLIAMNNLGSFIGASFAGLIICGLILGLIIFYRRKNINKQGDKI